MALNKHPQAESISVVQSAFPTVFPPTLYFEYSQGLKTERPLPPGEGGEERVWKHVKDRLPDGTAVPKMYWHHSTRVHVYNCVVNTLKAGGLHFREKDEIEDAILEYCWDQINVKGNFPATSEGEAKARRQYF